ncbi:MAG: response regulator transcription factor [Terrimicrobiaceae bacterium]
MSHGADCSDDLCRLSTPSPAGPGTLRRVLLADGEPLFLSGLRTLLEPQGYEVVGEAMTGHQLLTLLAASQPDLLIMGFALQCGRDALGIIPDILRQRARLRLLVIVPVPVSPLGPRLLSAGARGIFARTSPAETLASALQKIFAGESFIDPALRSADPATAYDAPSGLTSREREVFRLLGQEKSCKDIAALLGISPKTVERHRENIKAKLCLRTACTLHLAAKTLVHRESGGAGSLI